MKTQQRGGFAIGLIVGLLIGLALALGVALYVTKVPVPWINKVPQRNADQDAAEAERNRNWDPNAPLQGRNPVRPAPPPMVGVVPGTSTPAAVPAPVPNVPASAVATPRRDTRDPAAILADRPAAPAAAASNLAALKPGADPFLYFVQAGAYGQSADAEQQRARLAMYGLTAKITEREQSGRTVYRVRVGPFERKDDADAAKLRLDDNGVEAALVRVQK